MCPSMTLHISHIHMCHDLQTRPPLLHTHTDLATVAKFAPPLLSNRNSLPATQPSVYLAVWPQKSPIQPDKSAKEPHMSQKSPLYPPKSPIYPQKSLLYPLKSLEYPRKSPIYPQKSPIYLQKSPIYPQKSPTYPQKSPIYPQKSLVYPQNSHIVIVTCASFRTASTRLSSLDICKKALYTRKKALNLQKSPTHPVGKPSEWHARASLLDMSAKEPYISAKEPYICSVYYAVALFCPHMRPLFSYMYIFSRKRSECIKKDDVCAVCVYIFYTYLGCVYIYIIQNIHLFHTYISHAKDENVCTVCVYIICSY